MIPPNLATLLPTLPPDRAKALDALHLRLELASALIDEAHADAADDAEQLARLDVKASQHKLTPDAHALLGRIHTLALELRGLFQERGTSDLVTALRAARAAKLDRDFDAAMKIAEREVERLEGKARHTLMLADLLAATIGAFGEHNNDIYAGAFVRVRRRQNGGSRNGSDTSRARDSAPRTDDRR